MIIARLFQFNDLLINDPVNAPAQRVTQTQLACWDIGDYFKELYHGNIILNKETLEHGESI